ncbi:MAG: hypothetical protein DMG70_12560 [Acidobacteria bacterium]|nr:MAG: hypothetical protein DMG70_12560 [Acidobacteriota bacterium]
MRIRRRLPIILGVLLVAGAVALIVELRKHAPPEPARLLPGGDAFIYLNLSWVRRVNAVSQLPPVSHDPEYERFIQETGFQFERDLDRAAFAVHYPSSGGGQPRFTEVFEGTIHAEKLAAYLRKISQSVDNYRAIEIFNIPLEGRTLRVAILGVDTVAVSNHDDPGTIRAMIDRSRKLASPFGGPAFLRKYYRHVPIASLAWAIVRVDKRDNRFPLGNGIWSLLFPKQAVVVLSARYLRALHLRGEAFLNSEDDAKQATEQVNTFLNIFHSAESNASAQATDTDIKEFFDSLKIEQHNSRSVLTATLPQGFIRKVFTEPPTTLPVPEPQEGPAPPLAPNKQKQRRGPAK